jgi:hypothetical protein
MFHKLLSPQKLKDKLQSAASVVGTISIYQFLPALSDEL